MDADHQVVGVALSDESTANGIPDLFVDEIVLPVEGLESHAVGMGRHAVPYIHHHIASVIEIDAMRAVEHQLAACLAFHTDIAHVIGIDGFRYVAFQARHRGAIGTVPKTGQGERTIQYRSHAADPVQYAVTFKGGSESAGRDHRPYGVRRAGADADGEHLQNAEHVYCALFSASSPSRRVKHAEHANHDE